MRNYLLCCHSPPFICLIFYPSPAFPPFPSPTQPSVLLGEDPPPYSPLTSPKRGSAPEINCRVCQRIISVEGKIHQHVVKCGVCNEATVCSMYTHIPRSSGETSQMRKRWKLCVCTYLVINNTVIEAHGNLLLPTETFPSQIPAYHMILHPSGNELPAPLLQLSPHLILILQSSIINTVRSSSFVRTLLKLILEPLTFYPTVAAVSQGGALQFGQTKEGVTLMYQP